MHTVAAPCVPASSSCKCNATPSSRAISRARRAQRRARGSRRFRQENRSISAHGWCVLVSFESYRLSIVVGWAGWLALCPHTQN
ncbi:hypothetical protein ABZP36_023085 [Zizania latifolia]